MVYSVSSLTSSLRLTDYLIEHQARLDRAVIENASKKHADIGLALGAQTGMTTSFRSEYSLLEGQLDTNRQLVNRLDVTNTALENIQNNGSAFRSNLIALEKDESTLKTASNLAYTELGKLTSALNSNVSGVYVFGGMNSGTAPVTDFKSIPGDPTSNQPEDRIEKAFKNYFGFEITDEAAVKAIPGDGHPTDQDWDSFLKSSQFQNIFGADWSPGWSGATDEKMTATISGGVTTTSSESANDQAYRDLARGYSMIAVFGKLDLSETGAHLISKEAINSLNVGTTKTIEIAAQNGAVKENVVRTNNDITAKKDVLNMRINDLENVDENRAAVELSLARNQLEATYAITAKIKDLNILKYL